MNLDKSIELYDRARELMPGGVNSPVRAFKSVGGTPIFMEKGEGSRLTDADGNLFIDYCMSWGPLILGHAYPSVIEAVMKAAVAGTSFGTPNRHEVDLASLVTKMFPSIERVRFVNSGTEATMSAIRLARGATGRDKIIKFDGCYHGHGDYLLVAGGSGLATFGIPDSAGVTKGNAGDTLVVPFNSVDLLEEAFAKEKGSIAAVIMEPVPCNYGLIPPDVSFLKRARELCDEHGSLLIFDEVITGFRLVQGGAQELYGIKADITTLGKIIGGGLPVGAYGGSRELMGHVAPEGPVYQAGTLSGNPLAMAAGAATLTVLKNPDVYRQLEEKGRLFQGLIKEALENHKGKVLFLRLGSIFAFYFTGRGSIENVDQVREADMKAFARFHREMLDRGVYLSPSGYEVGFLSYSHTAQDIESTALAVTESLDRILTY